MAATRTSTRQAAQKAKEAISAAPDTKSRGGAGAKRKEVAHRFPEPKRSKKSEQKPVQGEDRLVDERMEDAKEQVEEKNEELNEEHNEGKKEPPIEEHAEKQKEEPEEPKQVPNEEPEEEPTEGVKEAQEEQAEKKREEQDKEEQEKETQKPQESTSEVQKPADERKHKPATSGTEAGVQKSQEREEIVPSNVLEKGVIYFFYRPRVNVLEPHSVDDIARSFIVLRPTPLGAALDSTQGSLETGAKCRLMMLPKKKFPTSGRERDMGFVEKAGQTMKELQENFIAGEKYETETRGERTVPEAKPYAEGVYAITSTKRASHLAYILTIPSEVGPLQEDFGLHARGSWIVQSKNPKYPGPSYAQIPNDPEYPESVREKFQDYRWVPLTPEFIDYANAQFLMVGEATDDLGKAATAEPGGKGPEEKQPGEELDQLEDENKERVDSLRVDKYGDTLGGIGSSIAIEQGSWHQTRHDSYSGIIYVLPDRGWNTNGTLNFQPRIHKLSLTLTLTPNASARNPSPPNLHLAYQDTILLTGPDNQPTTGLDADATGHLSYPKYPPLPAATYTGNGFGGPGPGGKRISLDPEGLALAPDGSGFWVSDEYGPYIYKFNRKGQMTAAIQPPAAILPHRNGSFSFSAASPPLYAPSTKTAPEDPDTGRNNNQGLEALTISPDGRTLYAMLQSALNQEGGPKKKNRQPARLLEYDVSNAKPVLKHEYAVLLPKYEDYTKDGEDKSVVASQSEIHLLPSGDFLVLSRDSGFGHGQAETRSVYRHADILSVSNSTTDLKGAYDGVGDSIASAKGKLKDGITPAEYCSFLDFNVEGELAKFGLHNGGEQDAFLLNEKWEGLGIVPVEAEEHSKRGGKGRKEYFLFSFSDNDFMTQDGYMDFGRFKYADESGYNVDNQVLVFRLEF
ncbi:hypothetical protein BBP40_005512 [Aspergillus hancockii]|nr:hypothetical protein BBP40_005512 [Aspergillus hancockii]